MSSHIAQFTTTMRENGIIAIIRLDDLSDAVPLVQALRRGGINLIEFTLTNPQAVEVLKIVRNGLDESQRSGLVLGVGSVKTVGQAQQCLDGGAEFIVCPIMKPDIIEFCVANEVPILPGAYTPTEIYQAYELGATAVKVFPARSLGTSYIKDILAPMPELKLVPTGGISAKNLADYERAGAWAVGVGGSLVDKRTVAAGDWDAIAQEAAELCQTWTEARNGK